MVCCVRYMRCAVWYCMLIQMLLSPSSSPPSFVGQTYIKTQWRDRISTLPTFTQKLLAKLEAEKVCVFHMSSSRVVGWMGGVNGDGGGGGGGR